MAIITQTLELYWDVTEGRPDTTTIASQVMAWSVDGPRTYDDRVFNFPLRTHRGIREDGSTYWIPFYDKSNRCSRGPLKNDSFNRYYWTQDGQNMRYSTLEDLERDSWSTGIDVGVPAPTESTRVTASEGGSAANQESRSYTYTYVSRYGEEGPPADPITVVGNGTRTWRVRVGPLSGDDAKHLSRIRLYRTVPSVFGSADFFLVDEFPSTQSTYNDEISSDIVASNTLLESTNWDPPPDNLEGLIAHPNGFFIGFVGRDIYMSEPYRPHAWPSDYIVSTLGDIVGFGIYDETVVVCTNSYPYTLSGINPAGMVLSKHDTAEPCSSRFGIVSMPFGVYYPSPNGLMLMNANGLINATQPLMTKEEWQNLYEVKTLDAARYQSQYVGFYNTTRGVMFAPDEPLAALVNLDLTATDGEPDQLDTIFTDEYTGSTFLINDGEMYEWNPRSGEPLELNWQSKEFDMPDPVNFGACRIIWYANYTPPDETLTQQWRDWNTARIQQERLNPINFAPINMVPQVDPTGVPDQAEIKQPACWSPMIWVPLQGEQWPNTPYVIFEMTANEEVVYTRNVSDTKMFRLPSGFKVTRYSARLRSNVHIQSVKIAETGKELARM